MCVQFQHPDSCAVRIPLHLYSSLRVTIRRHLPRLLLLIVHFRRLSVRLGFEPKVIEIQKNFENIIKQIMHAALYTYRYVHTCSMYVCTYLYA